jgi:hypothetical protein
LSGAPIDRLQAVRRGGVEGVIGLIYHRVGRRSPSVVDLDLAVFRAQLDRMVATGRILDLDAAAARLAASAVPTGGDGLGIVVTFDDGTADWVDVVLPELVARCLPATFYVSTDFVESGRDFPHGGCSISWSGLAELVATGLVTIGSHTHSHQVLAHATAVEAAAELDRSAGLIEDRLGVPCRHFAYPKAIAPSFAAEVVVRRRFVTAALAGNRVNVAGSADLHRLGRHGLTVADTAADFERKIDGGARLEGWLRERRDAAASGRRRAAT